MTANPVKKKAAAPKAAARPVKRPAAKAVASPARKPAGKSTANAKVKPKTPSAATGKSGAAPKPTANATARPGAAVKRSVTTTRKQPPQTKPKATAAPSPVAKRRPPQSAVSVVKDAVSSVMLKEIVTRAQGNDAKISHEAFMTFLSENNLLTRKKEARRPPGVAQHPHPEKKIDPEPGKTQRVQRLPGKLPKGAAGHP